MLKNCILGDPLQTLLPPNGASVFMAAVLEVCGGQARKVFVADSIEALAAPELQCFPQEGSIDL